MCVAMPMIVNYTSNCVKLFRKKFEKFTKKNIFFRDHFISRDKIKHRKQINFILILLIIYEKIRESEKRVSADKFTYFYIKY